jgi:ABC-type oligopeptide transport system substrate-binding subunit
VLASPFAYPWPRHVCERLGEGWVDSDELVFNGPYTLAARGEESLTLVANPHWVGPRGNVREIEMHFGVHGDRHEAWRAGRFDVMSAYEPMEDAPDTIVGEVSELGIQYLGFNATLEPFTSTLVRRAFARAIDRAALAEAMQVLSQPATRGGAIPPAMPGHTHRVVPEYDLEQARRLLAEAGHDGGKGLPELRIVVHETLDLQPLAEQLAQIGVRLSVREVPGPLSPDDVQDAHLWISGWTADYPDPDGLFRGLLTEDWPFACDDELLRVVEQARAVNDQGERMRLYHDLDRLFVGELVAMVPLVYMRHLLVRRPWVERLWENPLSRAAYDTAIVTPRPGS